MAASAAFIGLGNMGSAMALNLQKNGVKLYVYNRSKEKAETLVKGGAEFLNSPREAFQKTNIVFSMLANDQALHEMTDGENGLLTGAKPGCIHVSMSTVSPKTIQDLAERHRAKGVQLLSAPVFGRPDVAAQHNLWICLAGDPSAKKQAEPFLMFMGKKIYDFGTDPASANAVKLAGNFMILSVVELMGEAFSFVEKSGVPPESFHSLITDSIFPSPVFETYGRQILAQQFQPAGFKLSLGLKDIDLLLRTADKLSVPLPIAGLLHDRLLAGMANERGEMDWASITITEREEAGLANRK